MAASTWIVDHPINQDLRNLSTALAAAQEVASESDIPANVPVELGEVVQIHALLVRSLRNADPVVTPRSAVEGLSTPVQQATSELNLFIGNKNAGHVENARTRLDGGLAQIPLLWSVKQTEDVGALREAVVNLELTAIEAIGRVQATEKQASEKLQTLEGQLATLSTSIGEKLPEVTSMVTRADQERATLLSDIEGRFQASESSRTAEAAKFQEKREADWNEFLLDSGAKSLELVGEIETQLEKAYETMNALGKVALTGGYSGAAKEDRRAALWLRGFAIGLFVLAAGVGFISLLLAPPSPLGWTQLLARIAVVAAIAGPAAYCARESANFRRNQESNERYALQLSTIDEYLLSLPDTMRHEVKKALTEKFYTGEKQLFDGKVDSAPVKESLEFAKWLIDRLPKKWW